MVKSYNMVELISIWSEMERKGVWDGERYSPTMDSGFRFHLVEGGVGGVGEWGPFDRNNKGYSSTNYKETKIY